MPFMNDHLREIEMRLRQRALARQRNGTGNRRQDNDSLAQRMIADITARTMADLHSRGISGGPGNYGLNPGNTSGLFVQGGKSVARARSGETVVAKPETSQVYSHTETREPATITINGQQVSSPYVSGPSGGDYVQGGTSGSLAPFPDTSGHPSLAQDPTLITEPKPQFSDNSLAGMVNKAMAGVQPLPPPPPPQPVSMEQQAGDIVQQQPSSFFGWQSNGGLAPTMNTIPSSGGMANTIPVGQTGLNPATTGTIYGGSMNPGMGGVAPNSNMRAIADPTLTGPTSLAVGTAGTPTTSTNIGNDYLDGLNPAYDQASQKLGVPANAIKGIQAMETGGTNYVGQQNCKIRTKQDGSPDCVALDSGIFQSTAESHGLDYNRIVSDPTYAAYATGKIMSDIANSDAGQWKGPSGMSVCQWGDANLPGGCYEAVARVYFGGDITGQFVDEQGRSGAEYGQQFIQHLNEMGGISGGTQATGGATTGYQGSGPGGRRDAAAAQQPAYSDPNAPNAPASFSGNGPGGARDQQRIAEGTSIQAPPQDAGKAIAANTADPNMGNAIGDLADNYVGTRYVWGGSDPSGWDCSGFVHYIAQQEGISDDKRAGGIPNGSHYQYEWAKQRGSLYQVNDVNQLQPGDVIFFNTGVVDDPSVGGNMNNATHVGIYLGNGKFIQALNEQKGTVISVLDDYWMSQVIGASPLY